MSATVRLALIIEYDGTDFAGLQRQKNGRSIQGEVESAAMALGVEDPKFRASGRTDSGVHARGQVITINLPERVACGNPISALNWHLPLSIRVRKAIEAPEGFDPRRDARLRTYHYFLCAGQPVPPLMRNRMGRVKAHLDIELMRAAADVLRGKHDFREWRSSQCQAKRTVLDLKRIDVLPWSAAAAHGMDDQCFEIWFSCRSFLHKMVRYLVGGIVRVGAGQLSVEDLATHVEAGTLPPRVAPADPWGLVLESVEYKSPVFPE
ncbi:tRNA pseudouridine(38-40) synthase TruA [bacterium]|nr:tRNA pseudouridine(38-40) synthase TruA [bacterium]